MRLDNYLVQTGVVDSRNKAQTLIKEGSVTVDKKVIKKSAFNVLEGMQVEANNHLFVSRAAQKLLHFLPQLPFSVEGFEVLDIGSSTGGFCEVLLQAGAKHIDAVDVGSDQLHVSLQNDSRITSYENCDIRGFESDKMYDLVTCDVSFISIHHILEAIEHLASKYIIILLKPQFEVGKEAKRDKHGVLKDGRDTVRVMDSFKLACEAKKWRLLAKEPSALSGKEGNVEYCYCFRK